MINVFLLDDHEVVRAGLRDLLESDDEITVVGEASTGEEALARIPAVQPNVAILDVRLRDSEADGISVCRDIRSAHPDIACLMLTSYADDEALFDSVMAGAAGYLLKEIRGREIVDSVKRAARRRVVARPDARPTVHRPFAQRCSGRRALGPSHRARAQGARPGRRGKDEPRDRCRAVPRRKRP